MQPQTEICNSRLQHSPYLAKQTCVGTSLFNFSALQWNWFQNNLSARVVFLPRNSLLSLCRRLFAFTRLFRSILRTSFQVPLRASFENSRHSNERRNFRHLVLLLLEQRQSMVDTKHMPDYDVTRMKQINKHERSSRVPNFFIAFSITCDLWPAFCTCRWKAHFRPLQREADFHPEIRIARLPKRTPDELKGWRFF